MVGCVGGGSNFAGFAFPFIKDKITGKKDIKFVAVEPMACPTMTKGPYTYMISGYGGNDPVGPDAYAWPYVRSLGNTRGRIEISRQRCRFLACLVDQKIVEPRAYHQTDMLRGRSAFRKNGRHIAGAGINRMP